MDDFPKLDECLLAWLGAGRWRVLGHDLRPFTLMHRELLRMAGSGVITGQPVRLLDLDLIVQIGRRDASAAARWLARPKRRWMGPLRAWWLVLAYAWRQQAQFTALRHWLDSCENTPEMLERESPVQAGAVPFRRDAPLLLEIWTTLTAAGFEAREIVCEWPAGLARWLFETLRSREGNMKKFETGKDRELIEKARRMKQVTEPPLPPEEEVKAKMHEMMKRMRGVNR